MPSTQAAAARAHRPELADIFRFYAKDYQATYATSPAQQAVMRDIMQCRTAQLGGHLEACQSCGVTRPVYNSCRNRHCSKCQALDQAKWRATQEALLLPIPYFHVVFTLPHELTALLHAKNCVFRRCRTPGPKEGDHPFRSKPNAWSNRWRTPKVGA